MVSPLPKIRFKIQLIFIHWKSADSVPALNLQSAGHNPIFDIIELGGRIQMYSGFEIKGNRGAKCSLIAPKCSKVTECTGKVLLPIQNQICNTVETPYNTAPYITGSNIAQLGHGSQNSWSKLWIPMEAVARLPVVLPFRCHCHLPLLWHNRHYMRPWSSIHGQEGLIDANCICLRFTGTWAHRHQHPMDSCLQARWTRSVLPK